MKKTVLCLTLFYSLVASGQVQFGIFAGPQVTDVRYMIQKKKQESTLKAGVNMGIAFKIPLEYRLTFSPSVMYNLRGYHVQFAAPSFPPDSAAKDNNTSFHTVELAFLLQHDFKLTPGHFFFRIGPSLDFALIGKEKFHLPTGLVSRNMKFSFGDYGHYLASAIVHLGYEFKTGMFAYAYYNYSLTTMNNADGGPKIGNRAAGISLGKYLKK
jgi:hypothetical protein